MSSGASPGLIAGASEFPRGEEVLHDLNGRSWLPAFWQVAEASSNFRWLRKICFCYFCAMRLRGRVCYMFKFGAGGAAGTHNTKPEFIFGYVTPMFL